jgi:RimJ/RimL family protein N-acetyltransferase
VIEGVRDPEYMPFGSPSSDPEPAERARSTIQHHWDTWASWTPHRWQCNFVVLAGGRVVGTQTMKAKDFALVREVGTGSWLGLRHQGQGIGTEMRAAVLHLAFAGLGAEYAVSTAYADNAASLGVSRKLGYEPKGVAVYVRRGQPAAERRLRLTGAVWQAHATIPVEVEGLERCLPLFGLA